MGDALRRYDARVLQVMSRQLDLPLSLANLAARGQLVAAHIHITRHLPKKGAKLMDLAINAGVSKQAMSSLVKQCENWGLVKKTQDSFDKRIFWIEFTDTGFAWLNAFEQAVQVAEKELENDLILLGRLKPQLEEKLYELRIEVQNQEMEILLMDLYLIYFMKIHIVFY